MCGLAIALLTASLCVSAQGAQTVERTGFLSTLTPALRDRYREIVRMRSRIYMESLGLGIVLSVAAILYLDRVAKSRVGVAPRACIAGGITMGTSYVYYVLHPKKDYMLPHLTTAEQRDAWLKVYKGFQFNYHVGLLLGILGAAASGASLCS